MYVFCSHKFEKALSQVQNRRLGLPSAEQHISSSFLQYLFLFYILLANVKLQYSAMAQGLQKAPHQNTNMHEALISSV